MKKFHRHLPPYFPFWLVLLWIGCVTHMWADDSSRPYGMQTRVPWTTSRVVGSPDPPSPYRVKRVFPGLTFKGPVFIAQEPGTERLIVAEYSGKLYAFDGNNPDTDQRELFLDAGRQIFGFSFHPDYENNGQIFVFLFRPNEVPEEEETGDVEDNSEEEPVSDQRETVEFGQDSTEENVSRDVQQQGNAQDDTAASESQDESELNEVEEESTGAGQEDEPEELKCRVSRFTTTMETPRTCIPESEKIIVEWPAGGHSGGEAIMGPDGYLYVSTGDHTSGSDPLQTGQGVDDLYAVIMRLDVDGAAPDQPYVIPQDNPFVNYPGARPEIWAFGFRNPWRMSFDFETGDLWVGDVGQDLWEMIWQVQRGGNYGWSVQEGTHSFHPDQELGPGPILPPVIEHHHSECRSITGGYVYHGSRLPELQGAYIYGDYEYGKVWAVRYDGKQVTWQQELTNSAVKIASFGVRRDGEIFLCGYASGELYELEPNPQKFDQGLFPRRLSESGIFSSVKDHAVAPGVLPYSVNVPQWCDNAVIQRFVALPGSSKITFIETSADAETWTFEDGTVTVQTLSIEMEVGNPDSLKHIETRIVVKQDDHWLGYSYLWNDEQTDALLVEAAGRDLALNIQDSAAEGGQRRQTWRIPSRDECMVCHSRAAGFVLGLRTEQFNRNHDFDGVLDNQLRAWNHADLFEEPLEKLSHEYDALPELDDPTADLTERARAYLHVNCSVCHVPDGGGNSKMNLRYNATLPEAMLVDERPLHGAFGLTDVRIIAPGDPYASVMLYRLSKRGQGRMPHVGSNLTDEKGLDLLHDWVTQLSPVSEEKGRPNQTTQDEVTGVLETLRESKKRTAEQRIEIYQGLFSSIRRAFIASRLVTEDPLLETIRQDVVQAAMAHADVHVRDLFERFVPEQHRIKRLGDVVDQTEVLKLRGDVENGRQFFLAATGAQCKNCHRVDGTSNTLGPDLSQIGKKYKPRELLESLVNPSQKIDPEYVTHLVVTSEGKILTGILAEKTEQYVVLTVFKDGKGELVRLSTEDVEELLPQKKSLMPERLLRDLTAQQAADLVAFLSSLKEASPLP
ncbi:MAG: hypothetical protein CMJ81_22975 [Planctomycetaceae bacterium]|nr:hypothetical protein [Planctomycetaceae bacterium]MBP60237.1 hypothetical protein [Planctomycetaceae bacterium]